MDVLCIVVVMTRHRKRSTGTTTAIGYVRVSTDGQVTSGAGLTAQRTAITAECERRGLPLLDMYADEGLSGKSLARPALTAALDALACGTASVLVVAKVDRLSRSLADFAALMARAERNGWRIVALDLGIDTTSPAGEMMAAVVAATAQYERRLISARTRDALAAKKAAGVRLGRPAVTDPAVVARILTDRKSGATFAAIADTLTAENVPTARGGIRWYASTVKAVSVSQLATDTAMNVGAAR